VAVDVTSDIDRFDEALDWFLGRVLLTREEVDRLSAWARERSFWVTGLANARVLQDVRDEIARSLERGDTLQEFKLGMKDKLRREWTLGEDATSARLEVIYRNAAISSYNRGRHEQMNDPDVRDLRPWRLFDGVADSRQSNICRPLDGTIKRWDDPWWDSHTPQLHHQCRSGVTTLDDEERQELLASGETRDDGTQVYRDGPADDPEAEEPQEGFGAQPERDDEDRSDELDTLDPDLRREFEQGQP
jgi:SPP1 gp7 family putative phage head morphogenesis protein